MTVAELIKELSIYKDDLTVYIRIDDRDIEAEADSIEVTQSGAVIINGMEG